MKPPRWIAPVFIAGMVAAVIAPSVADAKVLPFVFEVSKGTVAPGEPVEVRVVLDPANSFPRLPPDFVRVFTKNRRDPRGRMIGRHTNLALIKVGQHEYRGTFSSKEPGDYFLAGTTTVLKDGVALPRPFRVRVADPSPATRTESTKWVALAASLVGLGVVAVGGLLFRSQRRSAARV